EIVEQIAKISDAQNEIRVRAVGIDGQSPLKISDGFLFLAETSTGHSAVGNGHHVFGVNFDGFVEVLERRLVIVQFIAVIGAAIVIKKGVRRRPRYCFDKKRRGVAEKPKFMKRCDPEIYKKENGTDGNAPKIFFFSEIKPPQQFCQHNDETDARQIG